MKKLLLIIVAVASISFSSQAQISKGNVFVGGNISNLNFNLKDGNAFSFKLNPTAAWFIKDGVAVGGTVGLGVETPGKNLGRTLSYNVAALGRYYGSKGANEVVNHSRFFAEATFGFQGQNRSGGGAPNNNTNGLGYSFGPGFAYFITNTIGLETLLKYNGVVGFGNTTYQHNLSLGIGFQIYLPGRATAKRVQKDINN